MTNPDAKKDDPPGPSTEIIAKVRMPSFCHSSPTTWFALVDSTFALNNIRTDVLKYHHVLISLPEDVVLSITDLIDNPPENNKYATIKNTILGRHTESETQRVRKLLDGVSIGDDKPSQYFRRLKAIAGSSTAVNNELLQQIWYNGLPSNVRTILTVSSEGDDAKIQLADKILETSVSPQISEATCSRDSDLLAKIEEMVDKKLSRLSLDKPNYTRGRDLSRNKSPFFKNKRYSSSNRNYRNRSNSRVRNQKQVEKYPFCYYHFRFKEKAQKCIKPCNFSTEYSKK